MVLKAARVLQWYIVSPLLSMITMHFFSSGSYFQALPNEDSFCPSLPGELCWGVHSNSSLHSCRLRKVGSRASRELLHVGLSTERGMLVENALQCSSHRILGE